MNSFYQILESAHRIPTSTLWGDGVYWYRPLRERMRPVSEWGKTETRPGAGFRVLSWLRV